MIRSIPPLVCIGLLIFVVFKLIDRFIKPLPNWLAIPVLLVSIALIIASLK